jgi:23S rRNA pseudouridine1911/1915/1917 synthase
MQDGVRIDRALSDLFSTYSRNFLANLLKDGHVLLNGAPATKPSTRVMEGQSIRIEVPDPAASTLSSQDIPLVILHQDTDFAVIDKPAGMVVHPAAGHADGTLVNALLFHVDDLSGIGGELRPGIVHRLDKDTSGVMIVAKNDEAHRKLSSAWNTDAIRKEYLAIIYGTPEHHRGTIDAPIGRHPTDRKKMAVVAGGRRAVTDYELVERLRYVSMLRCRLRTGRTHQIRVHLKHLGHPIVGDPVYAGPQWRGIPDRRLQQLLASLNRQALHATRITFPHPRTGEIVTFESPLPDDLRSVLDAMRGV